MRRVSYWNRQLENETSKLSTVHAHHTTTMSRETTRITKKMVEIKEIKDLVDWFEANHKTKDRVEFKIYKKHTGYPVPTHNEQVRTAICYGWIDTKVKMIPL